MHIPSDNPVVAFGGDAIIYRHAIPYFPTHRVLMSISAMNWTKRACCPWPRGTVGAKTLHV